MWIYRRATGSLVRETPGELDKLIGIGYSGRDEGLNNPAMESDRNIGPIPAGRYTVGGFHSEPVFGPVVARLTPFESNVMYGRSGFMIHGDNAEMDHTASHGCIVLPLEAREAMRDSLDNWLTVV